MLTKFQKVVMVRLALLLILIASAFGVKPAAVAPPKSRESADLSGEDLHRYARKLRAFW